MLLWGCRPKKTEESLGSHPLTRWGNIEEEESNEQSFGRIVDGVYHPYSGEFSLKVSANWQVDISGEQSGLQLRLDNVVEDCAIEIWKYEGIQYRPASKEGCLWAFQDKGLYINWGQSRAVNVATCHPIDNADDLIFVYLYHREGSTWQLESHVSRNNIVEGLHQSEKILQSISWSDDATKQKEEQNSEEQDENSVDH